MNRSRGKFAFTAPLPLGVYVHFPWCEKKCPYCDFNSHAVCSALPQRAYLKALAHDLDVEAHQARARPVGSVFLGGGTPSLISPQIIAELLDRLGDRLHIDSDAEITLEANPGSADSAHFAAYREAGVNRLSIGVQSFDDASLALLGRVHSAAQARAAVAAAHRAGFDNINLDLMYGLPEQTVDQALSDLRSALDLGITHLSWYQLTVEANTWFAHHPPRLPEADCVWDMHQRGLEILAANGFRRYEVSAFARDDARCRHNENYWRFGDYIGLGAGAHGKITDIEGGRIRRRWKLRHPERYLQAASGGNALQGSSEPDVSGIVFEYVLNRLRMPDPLSYLEFERYTGLSRDYLTPAARRAAARGLLSLQEQQITHTPRGWLFLDDLLNDFLPEAQTDA